jgi:hypothetical protein
MHWQYSQPDHSSHEKMPAQYGKQGISPQKNKVAQN